MIVEEINQETLIRNKHKFILLLEMNMTLNFPKLPRNTVIQLSYSRYEKLSDYIVDNTAIVFGAFEGATLVGFVWGYRISGVSDDRIHITEIVVDEDFQRMGIGHKLMNAICNLAIENGILIIEIMTSICNKQAISFYENGGFQVERVLMRKCLEGKNE